MVLAPAEAEQAIIYEELGVPVVRDTLQVGRGAVQCSTPERERRGDMS